MTWDVLIKNAPKLTDVSSLPKHMKYYAFFAKNKLIARPPFIILSRPQADSKPPAHLTIDNFNEFLGVPHASELVTIYENFCTMKYPKEPIKTLRKQCKLS